MGNGQVALDLIFAPPSLLSRSFTRRESTKILALFRAIESLLPPDFLLNAYAIPLQDKSGAVGVVALPPGGTTLHVITPYGTLLLLLQDELDASSAASVTSFIKVLTGGSDMMPGIGQNPTSAENRIAELEEVEKFMYCLREIAETSEDAESVRVAFLALTSTTIGTSYLKENPIKL